MEISKLYKSFTFSPSPESLLLYIYQHITKPIDLPKYVKYLYGDYKKLIYWVPSMCEAIFQQVIKEIQNCSHIIYQGETTCTMGLRSMGVK